VSSPDTHESRRARRWLPGLDRVHRAILSVCLHYPFLVIAAAATMMVGCLVTLPSSPVDVFPDFAPPQIQIQTESLGLSTSDVEKLVTVPLEQELTAVPGLVDMRSSSVPQLSSILLIFSPGTNLLHARQLVQERLQVVQQALPKWASPPVMLPPVAATARTLQIGMYSDTLSLSELSRIAYWEVKARLLEVDGVADVSIWNERQPTFQVQADPKRMAALGVTLDDVERTTADALDSGALQFSNGAVVGSGGFIEQGVQRIQVAHTLSIQTTEDLAAMPLEDQPASRKGAAHQVTLGDVAVVKEDFQPIIGSAVIDGRPGLLLVVEKLPWGNTLSVTQGVDDALKDMEPGLPGVKFDTTIFRPATYVDDSVSSLLVSLAIGFVLVAVVLVLFLFEWRSALIALVTIPLSTGAALLALHLMGVGINTMVLAGLAIALGDNVDDSVIDVENILRRLRDARAAGSRVPIKTIILESSVEIRNSMMFSTLIDVVAISPIFLLSGLTAAFFQPLVLAYALTILCSMLISLMVTPPLALLLLRNVSVESHRSHVADWLRDRYQSTIGRIVARPTRAFVTIGLVLALGIVVAPQLGQSLFPTFKQRDILILWDSIPGTSAEESARTATQVSRQLLAIPGVTSVGAHIGRSKQGEEVVGVNATELWVHMEQTADYDKTVAAIRRVTDPYTGIYREATTYLNERIEEVLAGSKEPITIRIYGENLIDIRAKAKEVLEKVEGVPGILDPQSDVSVDTPQIQIEVNIDKAAAYGLKPGDVRRQAAAVVAGLETGNIFKNNEVYGVVTWSVPSARDNPAAIGSMLIDTPAGGVVRLADVASVSMGTDPYLVKHSLGVRYLDVTAGVQGRDLGSVVKDIQQQMKTVTFPSGMRYQLLGEYVEREAAQNQLIAMAIVAAIAIFLMLQLAFGSWRLATLLFVTLPMSIVGGILAIWLGGGVISIGSLVGLFTVLGLAQGNGILMINHCEHLVYEEGETFSPAMVIRGARERLAPILMTTLATGLALVPLLFYGDQPGREIEHPLAVAIIGGLVTSTLLTLFVVPSLYLRFGRSKAEREALRESREHALPSAPVDEAGADGPGSTG
jgi:CzcA family heavy metal efflux pump